MPTVTIHHLSGKKYVYHDIHEFAQAIELYTYENPQNRSINTMEDRVGDIRLIYKNKLIGIDVPFDQKITQDIDICAIEFTKPEKRFLAFYKAWLHEQFYASIEKKKPSEKANDYTKSIESEESDNSTTPSNQEQPEDKSERKSATNEKNQNPRDFFKKFKSGLSKLMPIH